MTDHPTGRWPIEDLDSVAADDHDAGAADRHLLDDGGRGGIAGAVHAPAGLTTRAASNAPPRRRRERGTRAHVRVRTRAPSSRPGCRCRDRARTRPIRTSATS